MIDDTGIARHHDIDSARLLPGSYDDLSRSVDPLLGYLHHSLEVLVGESLAYVQPSHFWVNGLSVLCVQRPLPSVSISIIWMPKVQERFHSPSPTGGLVVC